MLFMVWNRDGDAARGKLMTAVRGAPGLHITDLSNATGLAWSTVDYHVRVMQRDGYLNILKTGRECYAFPLDVEPAHHLWFATLRDDDTRRVLRHLANCPGLSVPVLSQDLGFTEKVIRRHLSELEESGLAIRRGVARPVYEANSEVLKSLPPLLRDLMWSPDRLGGPGGQVQ